LGLLAALVGPKMFGKVGKSRQKTAKVQISLFETSLDTFRLDMGRYPTTEEGLEALREKPSDSDKWDGPYIPKRIPQDPWQNPYEYKAPGEEGDYDIISYGADGKSGGEKENKDIVNWKNINE
ncbi:MAG: type II secretion system major pseudopilin GspG, partial [Desulfosarcina sp.]|nr:type II secretion system major pseudopilin GspG [Desulfobacterales bacterium]